MIVNKDTGEIIDGRNDEVVAKLVENYEQFKRYIGEPIWKKFWQEVRIRNEELIAACTNGELDKVKKLVDPLQNMYPVDVNTKALDDWTPLHFAVASDNSDIVAFLIQNQADIEQLSSYDRTPLHIGALKGSYDSIKILIDSKVNIDAQDKDLYTALHYAAEYNHYDIVELLLKNGAKANILNHKQIYAYQAAKTPAIQELFKKYHQAIENPHSYNNNLLYGKEIGYSKVQFVEKMLQSQPWQQQQPPTNQVVVDPKQKKIEKEKNKIEKWQQIKPIAY